MGFDTNFTLRNETRKHEKKRGGMMFSHFIGSLLLYFFQIGQWKKKSIVYLTVIAILSPCCHVLKQISCFWLFDIKYKIFF